MDWLDLLAVQGTLKSLLQHQFKSISSSALSFLHSPTLTSIHDHWKNIALIRWTFVGKVMSLLFNMLSRLVINFFPRSKRLSVDFAKCFSSSVGMIVVFFFSSLTYRWMDYINRMLNQLCLFGINPIWLWCIVFI